VLEDEDEVDKTAAGLVGDFDNARSFLFDADDVDDENALDVLDVLDVLDMDLSWNFPYNLILNVLL
jgi:hypothetical protein